MSLPPVVPVRCAHCGVMFTKNRSTIWRVKPGTPLHCSKDCQYAAAAVAMTCDRCGAGYTKLRCEADKARAKGFAQSFCSRACSLAAMSETHAAGRRCAVCGTSALSRHATYCSAECRRQAFLVSVTCSQCGITFELPNADQQKKIRRGQTSFYCSHSCMGTARRGKPHSAAGLFTTSHPCVWCSTPTGPERRSSKYCSPECTKAARKAARPPKKTKPCPQCGEVFAYSSARRQYCTRTCANDAHALRMIGPGNSHFKDGTSYATWFRLMRPLIHQRDGHACRACLAPAKHVHHIDHLPWHNWPENLITLCPTCHAVHHKSARTPFLWFADYAESATRSMTSRWKATATSLQAKYSSTTA